MGVLPYAAPILTMLCFIAGCARTIELDGRRCPCVSGWTCDPTTNTCVTGLDASSDADNDSTDTPVDVDISLRKRVFVSSTKYKGDIGGIEAATAVCIDLAQHAGLGGDWMAFLSVPEDEAIERIVDVGPWYLINQTTLVAANKAQLVSSDLTPHLDHAINMTEQGSVLECNEGDLMALYNECGVWTGSFANGVGHETRHCQEWTVASSIGGDSGLGMVGVAEFPNAGWLNEGAYSDCGSERRLYCFEQ